jgi:hypothetical protein
MKAIITYVLYPFKIIRMKRGDEGYEIERMAA